MKLIVAVVRDEYASHLTEVLNQKGFGATKLASTGGFLKAGNTTFLIGLAAAQLDEAIEMIRQVCPTRPSLQGDLTFAEGALTRAAVDPTEALTSGVPVSGATIFVLGIDKMIKV